MNSPTGHALLIPAVYIVLHPVNLSNTNYLSMLGGKNVTMSRKRMYCFKRSYNQLGR